MAGVPDVSVHRFPGRDGADLAYRETGTGRPVVLIHGLFSTATVNWIRYRHAERLAARGFRVVMPDLRGHGDSAKPHDPAAYPPDVLADDGFALIEHLRLTDYDLGGYSLGGRTTVRMLVRGATPRRAVVAGMGLDGIEHTSRGNAYFQRVLAGLGTFERGSPEWRAEAFLRTVGGDPEALLPVLESSVDTSREEIARIATPTLVVAGRDDPHGATGPDLAASLPAGRYTAIPGDHMTAVANRALGETIAAFLTEAAA